MNWKTETLALVFAVAALSGHATASRGEESTDPSRFTYARLYCGPDGNSHFQDVTAELRADGLRAPGAAGPYRQRLSRRARLLRRNSTRVGAPRTWKTGSTILLPRFSSASSCRAAFPSPRLTARRDNFVPATCSGWRTLHPARDTSRSWATNLDSSCSSADPRLQWPAKTAVAAQFVRRGAPGRRRLVQAVATIRRYLLTT